MLTRGAEQDLKDGAQFYASESTQALGMAFIAEFERATQLLVEQPLLGAPWRGSVRRLPLRRFPFNVVYDIKGDVIRVVAVAHQRRRPGFWRKRTPSDGT